MNSNVAVRCALSAAVLAALLLGFLLGEPIPTSSYLAEQYA